MGLDFSKYEPSLYFSDRGLHICLRDRHNDMEIVPGSMLFKLSPANPHSVDSGNLLLARSRMPEAGLGAGATRAWESVGLDFDTGARYVPYTEEYLWSPPPRHIHFARSISRPLLRHRFKLDLSIGGCAVLLLGKTPILALSDQGLTPYAGYFDSIRGVYVISKEHRFRGGALSV